MKVCNQCRESKELNMFYRSANMADGYENKCKKCRNSNRKKYKCSCEYCGKLFNSKSKDTRFCGALCRPQNRKSRIEVPCGFCNKVIQATKSRIEAYKNLYCSEECKDKGYSLFHSGENSVHYNTITAKCGECGKEFSRWGSQVRRNLVNYCSRDCLSKGYRKRFQRENHPSWDFKISEEQRIDNRNIEGYVEWRESTFARDAYTCQKCGDSTGGNLEAHHILNYSEHPTLRTCLDNSITLCKECHKKFHMDYGYRNNNLEQLEDFLSRHVCLG